MLSPVEQSLSQVRTDKTGTASDQIAQKASWEKSERLGIIVGMMRMSGLRRTIVGRAMNFRGFLWPISVRIRIVAIGIVVIRAGRYGHQIRNRRMRHGNKIQARNACEIRA